MKRIYTKFLMLAMAAIAVVSCEKSPIEETLGDKPHTGAVLSVAQPSTRVSFEDEGTKGINPSWEVNDTFTLYDAEGARVDNFECTSIDGNAKFVSYSPETKLTAGAAYTALYPYSTAETLEEAKAEIDPSFQSGDKINDLDNSLYMLSDFNYSAEANTIAFVHQMAIMTFKFKSDVAPFMLYFHNGGDIYVVQYSNIQPENGIYTSHIMIKPCDATPRELKFELSDSEGNIYDTRRTTSSKAYEAGMRYTASVSDYAELMFSGGDGSELFPYRIATADDLRSLSDRLNGVNGNIAAIALRDKHFTMTADIDLGGEANPFTPIGIGLYPFRGIFDGAGRTISGLNINSSNNDIGLFAYITNAEIKNLTVEGSVASSANNIGGIAGYCVETTISNCHNNMALTGIGKVISIGGIAGSVNLSTIINCYNSAKVSRDSNDNNIGGIAGFIEETTVVNCYNSAQISGGEYAGGIIGFISVGKVTNCYNSAAVTDATYIGGIVGNNYDTVSYSYFDMEKYTGEAVGNARPADETCSGKTTTEMQQPGFTDLLNENTVRYNDENPDAPIQACSWVWGSKGYPIFSNND